MKTIKGDLILEKDTTFEESIEVEGNIKGYFDLKVFGDIDARNIDARNINARDINAGDIDAWNINAENIDALDIDAWNINARNINAENIDALDIICEKRIKKNKTSKTICRVFVQDKFKFERKEQMGSEDKQQIQGEGRRNE